MALKAIGNRVAILTGRGTIYIADFDTSPNKYSEPIDLSYSPVLKANYDDQITAFEWIKAESDHDKIYLAAGTLMGHIHIFRIHEKEVIQIRFISNAHFETVTSLA